MPGGHLTYVDHRKIAEGLAEGLAYAEIARRLGRPRSTIGREIARNGGPYGYRAARAQQATEWRARRRPKPPLSSPAIVDAGGRDPQAVREYEQKLTGLMSGGWPPMAAKVLICLLTSDSGDMTVAELVERLRVSPASISKAVGALDQLELVKRERDNRRERYRIDDDVWYQAWLVGTRSMMLWADSVREGVEVLGAGTPAGTRLRTASRFFQLLSSDMAQAAEHYRQTFSSAGDDTR
ncbi:helix-turn-helix domain-containing protein [Nonomuraea sp. K274]|uniref:Helix-turn-helix domain-containing protein n=1 Tax=Nonomuraea cypriaca TaxID=1187855 RepID=A0A931AFL0_9ACTN|nr:helix-turn-helix domain-containing protein [Nonomuraea cypriaca]